MLRTEEELSSGQMEVTTMENIRTGKRMGKAYITGQMDLNMEENGNQMRCTALESSYGQMEESTKARS